ncbi:MAG: YaaL family protein [Eubacterium sp.]|nr:YaaL family protein [Eubacterium sp.]
MRRNRKKYIENLGIPAPTPLSAFETKAILQNEIEAAQQALETANSNFENVSDPDLIDSYIYEMNAITFRYRYLLKQMRGFES